MFNFMRKDKTEEERAVKAEKDRRKTEKREKKKSSKRDKALSPEELERLEEVSRSLKMKGPGRKSSEELERANVVGLRYSQFFLQSGPTSPDSSDTASTWSSSTTSLGRPRGILKSKAPGSVSESSSKIDLDDEGLLLKNTQQNEMNIYKLSPGAWPGQSTQTNQNHTQGGEAPYGECLGLKSRKLLSNFALRLPVIISVAGREAWLKTPLAVETSSKVTLHTPHSTPQLHTPYSILHTPQIEMYLVGFSLQ